MDSTSRESSWTVAAASTCSIRIQCGKWASIHQGSSPQKTTFKGVIPSVEARCTGSIALGVVFGSPDNFRSKGLIFDIVPFHSGYHALLGRTAFARFNAVPHYEYLKLKMPGPRGVITVNGNVDRSLRTEEHTATLAAEVQCGLLRQTNPVTTPSTVKRVRSTPQQDQHECQDRD